MKKRIIAALLAVVMTVLCLASCGAGFSFADEDMKQYTDGTFDIAKFFEAIKNIEINDDDFTTDKATNDKKVDEDIYDKIATAYITEVGKSYYEGDKLTSEDINEGDIVYFCYFAKDADGNYFMTSDMKESAITASGTKAKHFIKLGKYDEDDGFMAKLAEALLAKEGVKYYSTKTKTELQKEEGNAKVKADDVIVVSYKVEYTDGGNSYEKVAAYEVIKLGADTGALATKIASLISTTGAIVNVGEKVQVPSSTYNGETDKTTDSKFEVVDGDITYKYSEVNIEYKIDSYVAENEAITFTYTDKNLLDANCDNLRNKSDEKLKLKERELTYYVYPVYRLDVPEISTESIIEYVYGKNVTVTSNELFGDDEYVYTEGETTKKAKDLVTTLTNLWKDSYEDGSNLKTLYDVYKDADKKVDEAEKGEALDAAEAALKKAEKEFYDAKRAEIRAVAKKIAAAKKGETVLGAELLKEYKENSLHSLKEKYNTYITETVGQKVWQIIDKQVKVDTTKLPADLIKQFADHLYESYEHDFYNGDYTPEGSSTAKQSNYLEYNGNLEAYLMSKQVLNVDDASKIQEALDKKAVENIVPIVQVYFIAQQLNAYTFDGGKNINDVIKGYVNADIEAGVYEAHFEKNESLSDAENAKAEAKAKEQADKNKESALKNAENFLVTDAVFEEYKKEVGKKTYQVWEEQYGEINIRAALQLDKLFYFLVSTDLQMTEDGGHDHSEPKYVDRDGDGKLWLSFRTVKYKFPAEKTEE